MQPAKRVALNTGFLYARMAITVFIALYSTRLILDALGANDFGIFNVVGGAILMLTFLNNAMTTASQRFMSYAQGQGNTEKQKNIFNVSVILHLIVGAIVVLILEVAGYFLFHGILNIDPERIEVAKLIYQFMLVSTFFTIISVPYDAVINAHENMLLVAVLGIIQALLKLGIAFYITFTSFDKLASYGFLMALMSILLLIIRRIYCHRNYNEVQINLKKYFNKPLFKEMSSFAGWSFLGCTTSMVGSYGQGIVLNMFFGTTVNAAQGVATQVRGQLSSFGTVMIKALNPVIAKSEGAGDRGLMLKASMLGSKISFFLLMVLYVPVLVEMPYIFSIWLKEVPEFSIVFCKLLLIRGLIEQQVMILRTAIGAVGNIKKFEMFNAPLLILPLIFSWFLFKFGYPPYTLYLVFILFEIFNSALILTFAKRECDLSTSHYLRDVVARCTIPFLLILGTSYLPVFFLPEGFIRLLIVGLLSVLAFLVIGWFLGPTKDEKTQVKEMAMTLIKKFKKFQNKA